MKRKLTVFTLILGAMTLLLFSACEGNHEHSYGEWTTTKEATCTQPGEKTRTCSCGETETDVIPSKGHSFSSEYTIEDSTCTTYGHRYKKCTREGCTATSEDSTIPLKDHEFGEWEETVAATCTAAGTKERKCKVCGTAETEELPMIGHEFAGGTVTKEATCTEDGIQSGGVCIHCQTPGEDVAIPKLGHNFKGAEEVTKEPTCTMQGEKTVQCTRCDAKAIQSVDAKGHSWGTPVEKDVTGNPCVKKVKESTCTVCSATKTEEIDPTHQWTDYTYYSGYICSAYGKNEKRVCTVCKKEEIVNTEKTGPHWASNLYYIEKEPTETSEGVRYKLCNSCGEIIPETKEIIPMLKSGNTKMTFTVRVSRKESVKAIFNQEMTVEVFDGDKSVAKQTTKDAIAEFELPAKDYTVKLSDLPEGYIADENGYALTPARSDINAGLTSKLLSEGKNSRGYYMEGDVIHDFTFTDYSGNQYRMSELLSEYEIVVFDFYFTTCQFCNNEFRTYSRQSLTDRFAGKALFVCVNGNGESKSVVDAHAKEYSIEDHILVNGLSGTNNENFMVAFADHSTTKLWSYPTKIIIDSSGVYASFTIGDTSGAIVQTYESLLNIYRVFKEGLQIPTPGGNEEEAGE